jgi:CubicO group peptidase (beta-lactamase class C family)
MRDLKQPAGSNLFLYLYLIILLSFFLVGAVYVQPAVEESASLPEEPDYSVLEPYITAEMKKNSVPGLSIVIFNDNKIEYCKGFGVKSSVTGNPVDEATVFKAASFSKTLTAYAAMILVEKGILTLDEPLNKYLKKEYLPDRKYSDQITLRMVLTHTSGLSNDSDGKDRKVYFKPGSYFSYSGAGFRYLQQVIEDVTGMSFSDFMEQTILKPLGMASSSFVFKEDLVSLLASGHRAGVASPIREMDVNAAYSLLSTPTDMAKFNMEICRPTLLKPETVTQMLSSMIKWQNNIYWGLGIGLLKSPDEDFFWHWGSVHYYCSIMVASQESKRGVVIMTNSNTGMKLAQELAIKIINEYFRKNNNSINPQTFDFLL